MKYLRRIAAFCFLVLCGCTASERSAYRDCVRSVGEAQLLATVEQSAICTDRTCVENIARERALATAEDVETCVMTHAKDASGN